MNLVKKFFFLVFVTLLITSCGTEQVSDASLKLPMDRLVRDEALVFNVEQQIRQSFTIEQDSVVFLLEKPVLLDIQVGPNHSYVYLRPGEHLSLDTISTQPLVMSPLGDRSKENEYLLRLAQSLNEDLDGVRLTAMASSEPDSFLIKLEQKFSASAAVLEEALAEEGLAPDFKDAIDFYLRSFYGTHLANYSMVYGYHHDTVPELPEDFYQPITSVDLTDNNWLLFENSRQMLSTWHGRDIDYSDYGSPPAYFAALLESAQNAYPGSLVGDYTEYASLEEYINFGNGIDNADAEITAYQQRVTNTYLQEQLKATIEPWQALKSGEPAPDFLVRNREGQEVRLADLAGKRVYIDVWATWCGPCIREIPALKTLEEELHDAGVQFVSISIDAEKDHEKWLDFIEERELGGLQLMADGAWQSDVVESYNIKGIPRFLLIDEEGKIISADAPRPSDPSAKDVISGEG